MKRLSGFTWLIIGLIGLLAVGIALLWWGATHPYFPWPRTINPTLL